MTGTAGKAVPGRRSRQAVPRPRLVKFFLAEEELAELDEAARRAGLARGAFAAEAALAAARGRSDSARYTKPFWRQHSVHPDWHSKRKPSGMYHVSL